MKTTTLTTQPCYNPYFMDNKEIRSICFYKSGAVLASVRWFGSNNNFDSITLPFEVKKAVRLNLERSDAFYMRDKEYDFGPAYILYIPADWVNLQHVKTENINSSWWSTGTRDVFTVDIQGVRRQPAIDKETGKLYYDRVPGSYTEKFDCNYIWHNTPEFDKCKELAENIKKLASVDLSAYQLHDIMEHYNIIKK